MAISIKHMERLKTQVKVAEAKRDAAQAECARLREALRDMLALEEDRQLGKLRRAEWEGRIAAARTVLEK